VRHDELEFEIEFGDGNLGRGEHHVHLPCLAAWERERRELELATAAVASASRRLAAAPDGVGGASRQERESDLQDLRDDGKISARGRDTPFKRGSA
jgi:hypothetical protein